MNFVYAFSDAHMYFVCVLQHAKLKFLQWIRNYSWTNVFSKYIKKLNPYSLEAVKDLLKKFKNNVSLIKGNSNVILKKIDMSKIDYVFLDGGHDYQTVKNDLNCCREVIVNGGTVLCDDYDLSYAPGVKKAIDEFSSEHGLKCSIICNDRFAKIEKN